MIGVGIIWAIGIALATVLVGMFVKWIIPNSLTEREASIAAFSLVLGNVLSAFLGSFILDHAFDYVWVIERIGSVVGLSILWWCLFRRNIAAG